MKRIKKNWTIVEIVDLGGHLVKNIFLDKTHTFKTKKSAEKELKTYGRPQDFRIVTFKD